MTVTEVPAEGLTIRDVKAFVELYRRDGTEAERLGILENHRLNVLGQLDEVQTHLTAINRKIDYDKTAVLDGK